jgi:hypothetical protein
MPGAGLRRATLVVRGGLGDAAYGHAQLGGEQRLVGHQMNDNVVDGPAGELGRIDRAVPFVGRKVAQEQDRSPQLDAVDVDRRSAGDHRSRLAAAPCLGEHPGAQLGGRRDVVHDRSGEFAGREAQVLLPPQGIGTGVEVCGDPGDVLGIVCVDRVGGQIAGAPPPVGSRRPPGGG